MTAGGLDEGIKDGEGMAKLKTVAGGELTVKQAGPGKLTVTDAKGDVAQVTIADVLQSNGVIHVIDTVLLPISEMLLFRRQRCGRVPHCAAGGAGVIAKRAVHRPRLTPLAMSGRNVDGLTGM